MKKSALLAFAVAFWLMPTLAASDEDDHNALRRIRDAYADAINNRDLEKIRPLLADGFSGVVVSGEEVKRFEDLQGFMKGIWDLVGAGGKHRVAVTVERSDLFGDLAVSSGYVDEAFHTSDNKDYAFRARWTAVARRQNGAWKIYRFHSGLNPMDNVIITEMLRRTRILYGSLAAGAGLLVGFLLRGVFRRTAR